MTRKTKKNTLREKGFVFLRYAHDHPRCHRFLIPSCAPSVSCSRRFVALNRALHTCFRFVCSTKKKKKKTRTRSGADPGGPAAPDSARFCRNPQGEQAVQPLASSTSAPRGDYGFYNQAQRRLQGRAKSLAVCPVSRSGKRETKTPSRNAWTFGREGTHGEAWISLERATVLFPKLIRLLRIRTS